MMNKDYIYEQYVVKGRSWADIAQELGTYPNKLRRYAKKIGIPSRDHSEAQKIVLTKRDHPTKGKKKSASSKAKVSKSIKKIWDNISDDERKRRSEEARGRWDKRTDKELFWDKAGKELRRSAKEGSKMEKHLLLYLRSRGYDVVFHGKTEANQNLEVDILLPVLGVAIEIDGPSHFKPVWGQEALDKVKVKDNEKNGLLLNSYRVLRLRYTRVTEGIKRQVCEVVEQFIQSTDKLAIKEVV